MSNEVIAIENRDIQKIPLILSLVIKNPSKYDFTMPALSCTFFIQICGLNFTAFNFNP